MSELVGAWRRLTGRRNTTLLDREKWDASELVDVDYAAFAVRTYMEQAEVRRYLARISGEVTLRTACDIGAGYGRMAIVLQEVCREVIAFEREAEFVDEGRRLLPSVDFRRVDSLERLPASPGMFDVALTFTVLQHLIDPVVVRVADEIKRVVRRPGFALLCEETDEGHVAGDLDNPNGKCTIGRSMVRYKQLMAPFELVESSVRRIEPTYPRPDVGTYMLFRAR